MTGSMFRTSPFFLDLKIVLKTVKVVLEHKDIGARGLDAPPDFHVYRSGMSERELIVGDNKNASEKALDVKRQRT